MKQKLFLIIGLIVLLAVPQMVSAVSEEDVKAMLNTVNDQLTATGEGIQVAYVDFQTFDEVGLRVYANDRQHKLSAHWAPFDPWRFGTSDISWTVDQVDQSADVPMADADAAISRAMAMWDSQTCANIPLVRVDDYGMDWGYVQNLVGMGGYPGWVADLTHGGWLPKVFFEIIGGPGGGDGILGVTFTFTWTARPNDVAFREIYYNEKFDWGIDVRYFDIETVVAHEVGHGLSLGHFGMIFRDAGNGHLQFAPRALMNAIYYDILHDLLGTDEASFCSVWGSWPNK